MYIGLLMQKWQDIFDVVIGNLIVDGSLRQYDLQTQKQILETCFTLQGVTTIDFSNNFLTEELAPLICQIIINNKTLNCIKLSNNDFRGSIATIINTVLECNIDLKCLDIVDNNISDDTVYISIARLIQYSGIKDIAIGANRIMGSSAGIHAYYDSDLGEYLRLTNRRPYHNTWWPNGYMYTGFNEIKAWSKNQIMEAVKCREGSNSPVRRLHLTSNKRSTQSVHVDYVSQSQKAFSLIGPVRSFDEFLVKKYGENYQTVFSYDRRRDSKRYTYSWEYYMTDEYYD